MATQRAASRPTTSGANAARVLVGLIWLAGAAWNLFMTARMSAPFAWLEESPVPVYRWFFREIAGPNPALWVVLLALGEIAIGVLTLFRGRPARLGLAAGALFSAFLVSLGTPYTLIMAPYALLLAWLARKDYPTSAFTWLRRSLPPRARRSVDSRA